MAEFFIDAVLVQQETYTVTIEAETLEEARAKAAGMETDMNAIADMVHADFDPGDGWLEMDTLRDTEDADPDDDDEESP